MLKIRLSRRGVKKAPFYRIVVAESRSKNAGQPLEVLGYWNPQKDTVKIDKASLKNWVEKGAKITKRVSELI